MGMRDKKQLKRWEEQLSARLDDALASPDAPPGLEERILARTQGMLPGRFAEEVRSGAAQADERATEPNTTLRFPAKPQRRWAWMRVAAAAALAIGVGTAAFLNVGRSSPMTAPSRTTAAGSFSAAQMANGTDIQVAQISAQLNQLASIDQPATALDRQINQLRAQVAVAQSAGEAGVWNDSPPQMQAAVAGMQTAAYGSNGYGSNGYGSSGYGSNGYGVNGYGADGYNGPAAGRAAF